MSGAKYPIEMLVLDYCFTRALQNQSSRDKRITIKQIALNTKARYNDVFVALIDLEKLNLIVKTEKVECLRRYISLTDLGFEMGADCHRIINVIPKRM
jgi:hypothetical protein